MLKNIFKKGLVIGIIILFLGASILPSISAITLGKKKDANENPKSNEGTGDVIFSDDFNDNTKDYSKWTEVFTDGTWWEQNQRTELQCYESGDSSERHEGIQSSELTVSLSPNKGIRLSCDFITHVAGTSSVGQPRIKIIDSSGNNWIEITYERWYDRTKFRDSNDGDLWTILENNKEDGSWNNIIQIFSNRYYIKMDSAESGAVYDTIFSTNPTLKVQIYIVIGGDNSPLYLCSGFDNVKVEIKTDKSRINNIPILQFIQNFLGIQPNQFPILQKILQRLGLQC